jgi:hypothetical protein
MINIETIKNHARSNYHKDGWDVLIECWTDKEILDFCNDLHSTEEAINKIGQFLKIYNDVREDIIASGR